MAKTYKYTGILGKAKPLSAMALLSFLIPEHRELARKAQAEFYAHRNALIDALFIDCDAGPSGQAVGWMKVALKLAERHVDAFAPLNPGKKKIGRRKAMDEAEEVKLFIAMETQIAKGHSMGAAAQHVAKAWRRNTEWEAFESRYRRFKRVMTKAAAFVTRELRQNSR